VAASADVVVAEDDETARRLAAGYGPWVHSIRSGEGAIEFPSPEEAAGHVWSEDERAQVADRVDTQFVGSPATVVQGLHQLQEATSADELIITTVTHDHADRVRSYELLADEWASQ
jgi:alkanesulfonate monooxygenase SsuD/methylene tetrahydromethanopterin reductase-like flavin-dependent oxidoreductase (luciferase family)